MAHVIGILEERGDRAVIEVGESPTRQADNVADLVQALPTERRAVTLRRRNETFSEQTYVLLYRSFASVRTTVGDDAARVLVDRVADYLEARPHRWWKAMQRWWWIVAVTIIGAGSALAWFQHLVLLLPTGLLLAALIALEGNSPHGAVLLMRNHADSLRLWDENRRTLWITGVVSIASAAAGSLVTWLLTK